MQFPSQITDVLRMDLARGLICRWFVLVLTIMLVGGLFPLALNAQEVTTIAGDGTADFAEGTGTAAQFHFPTDVAVQGDSLFVADLRNNRIRKIILSTGQVTTVAGDGTADFADGTGTAARFSGPYGLAVQGDSLFVADTENNRIRVIKISTQEVTTIAGDGTGDFAEGAGTAAQFNNPWGVAVQGDNLYVADMRNQRIRKIILSTGQVTTVAGDGTADFLDGTGTGARFNHPMDVAVQGDNLYVADQINNRIRKIILSTGQVTTVAGDGTFGFADGTGTAAWFNSPGGVAVQGDNLYVGDTFNNRIRKIILSTGQVTTVAGYFGFDFADGTGTAARFLSPQGLAVQGDSIFVADTAHHRIRKIVLKPIIVTSSLLTFGNVPLADGVTTVTDTIKIKNTGAQPLTVSAVNVSGLDASSYSVVSPASFTVSGGDSTNLVVAFSPSAPGRSDASLVLTHNDADAGNQTTIALHANVHEQIPGDVIAWGANWAGQTDVPTDLTDVIAIDSGLYHSLALRSDSTVVVWGGGPSAGIPGGLSDVVAISSGFFNSLALKADGTVVAWGDSSSGQIDVPADLIRPVAMAVGIVNGFALKSDGTVVAWGDSSRYVPANLTDVIAISSFYTHILALKVDGTVVAWGDNNEGQTDIPPDLTDVTAIFAGFEHSLALKSDGTVVAWGNNGSGQTNVPGGLTDIISLGGGANYSLALRSDSTVVAWGSNSDGQTNVPANLNHVLAISAGHLHNLALKEPSPAIATSSLLTFGDVPLTDGVTTVTDTIKISNKGTAPLTVSAVNVTGLGAVSYAVLSPTSFTVPSGDSTNLVVAFSPSAPGRSDASLVLTHNDADMGNQTSITLHANVYERIPGYVIAWGSNVFGQTDVPADLTDVIAIESGYVHGLALKLDGTVVGWGAVPNDSLGLDFDEGQAEIPVGLTDVVTIAGGFYHSLALKADGTVAAWGSNSDGETDVPVDLNNPVAIAAGYDHSLALKSDGTVVAWGDSSHSATNVPVNLTDVIAISSVFQHILALKSDGTVVAWGDSSHSATNVPVDLTDVIAVAAGYGHSLALKSDGTVVAWGNNGFGQTDVPSDWTYGLAIAAGYYHNLALKEPRPAIATSSLLTFGGVPLEDGVATVTDTIKISNKGRAPLTVSAVNVSGMDGGTYAVLSPTSFIVPAGDSTNLAVAFSPSAPGRSDASLVLTHDDADAGNQTTIALHANVYESVTGYVIAWGDSSSGETDVPSDLTDVVAITAGDSYSLALKSDGTVVAWGGNSSGQTDVPSDLTDVTAIAAGWGHSLALKSDGMVVAWGRNSSGQTDVPSDLTDVVAIAAGDYHSLALRSDGTVVAWGGNSTGETDVPADLADVTAIAGGWEHSLALKSDGTVVSWGRIGADWVPLPNGLNNIIAITLGSDHGLGLKSDSTVVAWGDWNDPTGQLSWHGTTNVPPDLKDVIAIAGGSYYSLALKSDGTVQQWGGGITLGSLQVVPSDLGDAVAIAAGANHSLALRAAWVAVGDTVLPFANVNVGNSTTRTLKIKNKGTFPLVVSAVTVVGPDSSSFSATPTVFTVAGLDSFDLSVTFAPSSAGAKSATLSVTHNATGSPSLVALTGAGGQSSIELSSQALSLGLVPLGSSSTEYFTVKNTGAGQLAVSSIGLSDGDSALFKVTPAALPNVSAGDSAYVRIDFTPVTTGDFSTTLTLSHNASSSPLAVMLTGKGTAPEIEISSGLVSLGPVQIGSSAFDSLKVKNLGTAQLVVSEIGVSGGEAALFTVTPPTLNLAAGDSAFLRIAFTPVTVSETIVGVDPGPVALGDFSTTLSLTHNAGSLVDVSLSGLTWATWRLFNARPNPFNSSVSMAYEVPVQTHVTLTVYNMLGQEVVRLVDQVLIPGRYEAVWDGINARGIPVSGGIYLYRLTCASGYTDTKRMVFLK